MNSTALLAANPFAQILDPERLQAVIARSKSLNQLRNRECRPLDRAVIRSASAELAAWDGKIDRKTQYLAPGEQPQPIVRAAAPRVG